MINNMTNSKLEQEVINGREYLNEIDKREYLIYLSAKLSSIKTKVDGSLFSISDEKISICLTQFIVQRYLFTTLHISLLRSLGRRSNKIVCTLPPSHLAYLINKENFHNSYINRFKWFSSILYWYTVGLFKIFEIIFELLKKNKRTTKEPFVYFSNLSVKNFPKNFFSSKTIINWFLKNDNNRSFKKICHNVDINSLKNNEVEIEHLSIPFNLTFSFYVKLELISSMIWVAIMSFIHVLKGKYQYALLLKEYPYLLISKKIDKSNIASRYYFSNSTAMQRPLWSYEVERKGSDIILYYYSANQTLFKNKSGNYYNEVYNLKHMTWPKYYVWHEYQKNYLAQYFDKDLEIIIKGPIWFESNNEFYLPNQITRKKTVSIFDVNVYKLVHFLSQGHPYDYFTSETLLKFHKDIIEVIGKCENTLGLLKNKRSISKNDSKSYNLKLDSLYKKSPSVLKIDASIDAYDLIQNSVASINIPFTSTAHIAKEKGIPTVYYDPINFISKDDLGLAGISLIQNKEELQHWLLGIINNTKVELV